MTWFEELLEKWAEISEFSKENVLEMGVDYALIAGINNRSICY